MIVSSTALEAAFLKAWARTGAEPGVPVSFTTLAQEWRNTGLRMSDLRDAVREMIEKGHALARDRQGHLALELTHELPHNENSRH